MRVIRRGLPASRALGLAAAGVALSLGVTTTADAAVTSVGGGAFGASVDVTTLALLHVTVGPTPQVTLPSSGSASAITSTLATVSAPGLLSTGVLSTSTVGTPSGGTVDSSADVANAAVPTVLTADAIHSTCHADGTAATGNTVLTNVKVAGVLVAVNPAPNTKIQLDGLATVTLNEQIPSGSSGSPGITVNAIHVKLLPGLASLGTGDIVIAQSQCSTTGGVTVPVGAIGGVLMAGVVGVLFAGYQLRRRRDLPTAAA